MDRVIPTQDPACARAGLPCYSPTDVGVGTGADAGLDERLPAEVGLPPRLPFYSETKFTHCAPTYPTLSLVWRASL